MDFLQFQPGFEPQAKLEEVYLYIFDKIILKGNMETNRNLSWLCTMVNERKTNISYPTNKNIRIGDRDYAKRR